MLLNSNIKLKFALIIAIGILSTIIYTTQINAQNMEASPSLAHLTKFVGKYPSGYEDDKNGKSVKKNGLLDDQAFRQVLMKAVGNERFEKIMSVFHLEIPIEQKGQLLYLRKAMPHNASSDYAEIFINLADNSVEVCWANEDSPENLWLSSKRPPRKIPKTPLMEVGQNSFGLFEKYGSH
jgi:hypothetical protein